MFAVAAAHSTRQTTGIVLLRRVCSLVTKKNARPAVARRGLHLSLNRAAKKVVPGAYTPPDPDERLKQLKSGEKKIAVVATASLLIGYFALKRGMSSKSAQVKSVLGSLEKEIPVMVVAGPSGSGKSTLLNKLFRQYPDKFAFSISHTTRRPRSGETNGKEYYFTTKEEMQREIENGKFIEWAEFSGNLYGTSIKAVADCQKRGKICVLDIDMQGVRSIKKTDLSVIYVHIKPPTLQVLEQRLKARKSESEESLRKRFEMAKQELEYAATPGIFDHVVVNDNLDEAYGKFQEIVQKIMDSPTRTTANS